MVDILCTQSFDRTDKAKAKAEMEATGDTILDLSAPKKIRKVYGLNPQKWNVASKMTKTKFQELEASYRNMKNEDELKVKSEILKLTREYVQVKFRTCEPSTHVTSLKTFWAMPDGLKLLSEHFNWVTDNDCDVVDIVLENLSDALNMAEKVLIYKKGSSWEKKLRNVELKAEEDNGNETMIYIFILRELALHFRNVPEKFIFIEGEDDVKSLSSQPFIHVLKVDRVGEEDYGEGLSISVRIGSTLVFDNVSFAQALASVIQLTFCFNLLYPSDCDDMFEFLQRVVCKFGPSDGARNKNGQLKKCFVDFMCTLGQVMMDSKKGSMKQSSF